MASTIDPNDILNDPQVAMLAQDIRAQFANAKADIDAINTASPIDLLTYYETSDGTDLQYAFARAAAAGVMASGYHIKMPKGQWTLGAASGAFYALSLSNLDGFRLSGWGRDVTTLVAKAGSNIGFANMVNLTNCIFEDFEFSGDNANNPLGGRHGFRGNGLTGCYFYRLRIREALGYGVEMGLGLFKDNTFEDVEIIDCGYDGIDHKNRTAGNQGNIYTRVRVIDWSRRDTTQSSSAFDIRGGATLVACEAILTEAPGTALIGFTCRPDDSWDLQFSGASGTVLVNSTVTGATSGASGRVGYVEQNGTTGTVYARGVAGGVFLVGETINFSGAGSVSAVIAAEQVPVPTGGRAVQMIGCRVIGPGSSENTGSGFSINNDEAAVIGCHAKGVRIGFASGLQANRATFVSPLVEDCITGIKTTGDGLRVIGGSLVGCTESAIELTDATNTVVDGTGFEDCAIGIWQRATTTDSTYINLRMTNVDTPYSGSVPTSDYVAIGCPGLSNSIDGNIRLQNLPTSDAGLTAGFLYNDSGTIKIKL